MNNRDIELIIPTIPKDYKRVKRDLNSFFTYLPIKKIVFIGPEDLKAPVEEDAEAVGLTDRVCFLNENEVILYSDMYSAMENRIRADGYLIGENSKPGWYYQQFLKMAYASKCECGYYMSWDSDTIPLRRIEMFDREDRPYFDMIYSVLNNFED